MAIGHKPNTDFFRGKLELDNKEYVKKYDENKTNIDGIFVAGDVYDYTYTHAETAAGSGYKAAIDAIKYLESKRRTSNIISTSSNYSIIVEKHDQKHWIKFPTFIRKLFTNGVLSYM